MKTNIEPKQLFPNYLRAKSRRFRWAGLALSLGLLNLALADGPNITKQPTNRSVSQGGSAQFTESVGSDPTNWPITLQWWFKDAALDAVANSSAAKFRLSLTNVTLADAGPYFVVASDLSGSATSQVAALTIDPTFIKVTEGAIVTDLEASAKASWCDYDGDGFQDLFVANFYNGGSATKNSLYRNNGDGTFTKITNALSGKANWWRCGVWADVDNDGDADVYVSGAGAYQAVFYRNDGQGQFTPVSIGPAQDPAGRFMVCGVGRL